MKKIIQYICFAVVLIAFTGCEIDNFDGPNASLSGRILIAGTNELLSTDQGKDNMTIRMKELSWKEVEEDAIAWQTLNIKMDGSYNHDKLFSGTYLIFPYEGPFYPILEENRETIEIKGNTVKDFFVTPYLKAEWVEHPNVVERPLPGDAEKTGKYITCTAKFTRIEPPAGYPSSKPDLNGTSSGNGFCRMFVSTSHWVGAGNLLQVTDDNIPISNAQEGQEIRFNMRNTEPLKYGQKYYVRVGFSATGSNKKYNYTTVYELEVPPFVFN